MAQTKMILYSSYRSSCSWRVRIALECKGIDYKYKAVNLMQKEQYSEKFLKINPLGEVPVLIDKGSIIRSSIAILDYLEETRPDPPLLPVDPLERAQIRAFVDNIVAGIQPLQNLKVVLHIGDPHIPWAQHWIESGFTKLEKVLQSTSGQYCFGDKLTFADLCLVPQVYNAASRFQVDMAKFPLISEITARLNALKPFQVSHPENIPDTPHPYNYKI